MSCRPWTRNLSYYLTWSKLHRVWISNGSEVLRWFETNVLGFETEICQGSWLRNLQYQRGKKGAQRSGKSRRGRDGGGGSSSSRYSCKQHIALNFSNVEVYINNQQFYNSNGLYAHKSYISHNFGKPPLTTREFCTLRGTTMKNFLMKFWKLLCLNLFPQGEWKCLADPMASCCMVNWGLTFSPFLNCFIQIWNLGYD